MSRPATRPATSSSDGAAPRTSSAASAARDRAAADTSGRARRHDPRFLRRRTSGGSAKLASTGTTVNASSVPGDEREGERQRHGLEDFPFDALQRVERDERREQDRLGEQDRPAHLRDRLDDRFAASERMRSRSCSSMRRRFSMTTTAESTMMPKSIAPMRNQVGRDAAQIEQQEGAEQRERHRPTATTSAERKLPRPRKSTSTSSTSPMPSIMFCAHGVQRAVDEIRAVVIRHQLHAGGQVVRVDLRDLGADALEHLERVLAAAQDHDALTDVVLVGRRRALLADAAEAQLFADLRPSPRSLMRIGRAVAGVHRDARDILEVLHEAEAAHDVHFRAVLDVGAAGVAVAVGERGEDLVQRDAVGLELQRDR